MSFVVLPQLLDWIVHVRRVNLPGTPAYNLLLGAAARAMADGPASSPRGIRRVELIFQEMLRVAVPADEVSDGSGLCSLAPNTRNCTNIAICCAAVSVMHVCLL